MNDAEHQWKVNSVSVLPYDTKPLPEPIMITKFGNHLRMATKIGRQY